MTDGPTYDNMYETTGNMQIGSNKLVFDHNTRLKYMPTSCIPVFKQNARHHNMLIENRPLPVTKHNEQYQGTVDRQLFE